MCIGAPQGQAEAPLASVRDAKDGFDIVGSMGRAAVSDEEVIALAIDEQMVEVAEGAELVAHDGHERVLRIA
jgi:hypothetical protein